MTAAARHGRSGGSTAGRRCLTRPVRATGAALLIATVAACDGPTGPAGDRCGAPALNPGVSLRSGFVPRGRVSLSVGATCTLASDEAADFEIGASDGPAEYLVAVQSASAVAGATASLRLRIRGPGAEGAIAASRIPARPGVDREGQGDPESRFRAAARTALTRAGARPARAAPVPGPRLAVTASPPAVGQTVVFRNSVGPDLDVDCDRTETVTAVVRAVGSEFAVAEDVDVAGHIQASRYQAMLQSLEQLVFPVDTAYFGPPADLDGNDRVWVLLTAVVNRATPRGSGTFIAGFFNPSDLSDPATCGASNRGELLYVLAPDPAGAFSNPVGVDFAVTNAIGVTAHELEHLLSAQQRVVFGGGSFADLEDAWLGEGLAHTAETVVGLRAANLAPGSDAGYVALAADPEVFASFHFANFRRAGYYLEDPAGTPALGTSGGNDPGGVPSLRMRGFAWLFLRWLADQSSVPGGGILGGRAEETLFRDLSSGGPMRTRGVANVERVAARVLGPSAWRTILARYVLAPGTDSGLREGPPGLEITTLDLPDVFAALHETAPDTRPFETPYPLAPVEVALEETVGASFDFDVGASAARYFALSSADAHPDIGLTLTTASGADVPPAVRSQIVLVRTR